MTNEEYHAADGISSSDFRLLEVSPLHYLNRERFRLEGSQFDFGTLLHAMVLEPETLEDQYAEEGFEGCRLNKNSKAYKEAKAAFEEECRGKSIVSASDWETAQHMAENVRAIAGGILQGGMAEASFFVRDDEFGVTRKCRPDYYLQAAGVVVDLKTTRSTDPHEFERAIYDYRYHRQAAWYLDALELAGFPAERFIIVAVEKNAPHLARVFEIQADAIEAGRENYRQHLQALKEFRETGRANVVEPISLPAWYWRQQEAATA
ncbi:PD-(D/E)XK nuclease-like domain-containing protein [Nitratifractor salsuginis]|nr:PD-(D/E)XK nuclease-like domain-containing protein [Nitratifractor salsuginis]